MSEDSAEEKMQVTKEELKELIDERVEKRLKKEKQSRNTSKQEKVSRRDFLKKLGVGALGLGALSLPSVSALEVKDESLDVFTGASSSELTKYFSVSQGGPVNIQNTNLDLNNQNISGVNQINGQNADNIHSRYTDGEAQEAVEGYGFSSLEVSDVQRWYEPNDALQRADARSISGNEAALHWYGKDDSGGTRRMRHEWYDGSSYVSLTSGNNTIQVNGNDVATKNWVNDNSSGAGNIPLFDRSGNVQFGQQIFSTTNPTGGWSEIYDGSVDVTGVAFLEIWTTASYENYGYTGWTASSVTLNINGSTVGENDSGSGTLSGSTVINVVDQTSLNLLITGSAANSSADLVGGSFECTVDRNLKFLDELA